MAFYFGGPGSGRSSTPGRDEQRGNKDNIPPEMPSTGDRWRNLANDLEEGRQFGEETLDDWRSRFRDDYKSQMLQGAQGAANTMQADATMRGVSPALLHGAVSRGGELMSQNNANMAAIDRAMTIEEAMARYRQAQTGTEQIFAMHDLYGQDERRRRQLEEESEANWRRIKQEAGNRAVGRTV